MFYQSMRKQLNHLNRQKAINRQRCLETLEHRHLLAGDFAAGDANQDYFFDQSDFVLAHQAGTYETDAPATWSQGDWSDDGKFNSVDYVFAFTTGAYRTGAYNEAATQPQNQLQSLATEGEADVNVIYDTQTGDIGIYADESMSTIHLNSEAGIFTHGPQQKQIGLFDVNSANNLFQLHPPGRQSFEFSNVATLGLTAEEFVQDVTIEGSFRDGGDLGTVVFSVAGDPNAAVPQGRISGVVFNDLNDNGSINDDESGYEYASIQIRTPDGEVVREGTSTGFDINANGVLDNDEAGRFSFGFLSDGDYTIVVRASGRYEFTTPSSQSVTVQDGQATSGFEFGVKRRNVQNPPVHVPDGLVYGDANRDHHFSESDFIQVMKQGKFESDAEATWEQGDWSGDQLFNSRDLVVAFANSHQYYGTGPYSDDAGPEQNDLAPLATEGAPNTIVYYDPDTGDVAVQGDQQENTTVHLVANTNLFIGSSEQPKIGLFDINDENSLFRFDPSGVGVVYYKQVAQTGLTDQQFLDAVTIDGSNLAGGDLGVVRLGSVAEMPDAPVDGGQNGGNDGNVDNSDLGFVDQDEAHVTLTYDQSTGDITVSAIGDAEMTTMEIVSNSGIFINADNPAFKPGIFDVANQHKLFRLDTAGSTTWSYPGVATTGLSAADIESDLIVSGSVLTGGRLLFSLQVVTDTAEAAIQNCHEIRDDGAIIGDANRDGHFDSKDLISVFEAGHYEDFVAENSSWQHGDWNCDMEFDSKDIVVAFVAGKYEAQLPDFAAAAIHDLEIVPSRNLREVFPPIAQLHGPLAAVELQAIELNRPQRVQEIFENADPDSTDINALMQFDAIDQAFSDFQ